MGMMWFRMYHEMIEDPKIGTLTDAQFRLWVELLCLACCEGNCGDTGMNEEELNWKLRRNVSETLHVLFQRNLIEHAEYKKGHKTIKIKNWEKRQYTSDNSTDRVRKYREKQKKKEGNVSETLQKQECNVIDTDTDINIKEKKYPFKYEKKVPIPKNFCLTDDMRKYAKRLKYIGNDLEGWTEKMILSAKAKGYKYQDWHATWKNWFRSYLEKNPKLVEVEKDWRA